MSTSKLDTNMKNMLKSFSTQSNQIDDYSFLTDQKPKKPECIKHTNSRTQDNKPVHHSIQNHPLFITINKPNKEPTDLTNNKNKSTLEDFSDREIKKQSSKQHQSNYFSNNEEDDEFYNFDSSELNMIRINDSISSCVNNNQNNNNDFKQAPFKLLSRTDCSNNDHNSDPVYNYCSSEIKKKFQRANRIFYNGFLNKQDKSSTLPEYQTHAGELLGFLKSLWLNNQMCDLLICIGNKKYLAHKLGLAMFSRKYREEFTRQQMQNKKSVSTICLKSSTPMALQDILNYIYTAKIDINPSNVEEILECAKELGIDDLICMAKDYLNSLSMGDILDFMSNTLSKDGADLVFYELYCYLMTHLDKISRTPEYAKSSISTVRALLVDSHLAVRSELEVFEAAIRWINFDKSRHKFIGEIMKNIRFTLMTPDELITKVECQPIISNDSDLQKMLFNAFKFHALNSSRSNLNGICQREELRNICLKGASVPEEFVKAVIELSEIAHKLKESRNYTSSNLINCDDSDDCMPTRFKSTKNTFNNFNNNNNNCALNSSDEMSASEAKLFKNKYEEMAKKMSKVFSKISPESDSDSKCSRCKIKK